MYNKKGDVNMKDREVIETLNDMKGVFGERGHSQYSLYSIDRAIAAIEKTIDKVKITERGWAGHFICANRCRFRRNTLIEYKDIKIVVSSVGLMEGLDGRSFEPIGAFDRYYETMCWYADLNDTRYYDIDVEKQISLDGQWAIDEVDADDKANVMHDNAVEEIKARLISGEL